MHIKTIFPEKRTENDDIIYFQVKFCKRNPGFMDSVRLGAVRAIDECQYQFRQRRWNCSSLQDNVNNQVKLSNKCFAQFLKKYFFAYPMKKMLKVFCDKYF